MSPQLQPWMPSILALFGAMIVVIAAWLNIQALNAQVDALRAEMQGEIGSLRSEVRGEISSLRSE